MTAPRRIIRIPVRRMLVVTGWVALLAAAGPVDTQAQVRARGGRGAEASVDSADVRGRARREQARFERFRVRHLPKTASSGVASDCDEIVGRFCLWFTEGHWVPAPEDSVIIAARFRLLAYLDSVQALVPGDGWILGQRVWYRGEAGRWGRALAAARECGGAEPWWCDALQGLALHGLGRYDQADVAFSRALETMDSARAAKWREPERELDGGAADILDDAEKGKLDAPDAGGVSHPPAEQLDRTLRRIWTLADPLYLVPGNDRRTEHYARWTVSVIREDALNPYLIAWGRDLTELLVRFGWELGWEATRQWDITQDPIVVGHQHPEGREYMPSGRALEAPSLATSDEFWKDRRAPRSLHAPAYAPLILPMDGQVAAFPRGDSMAVVATAFLPADTTEAARKGRERPWMKPGDQAGMARREGLFLVPADVDGQTRSRVRDGRDSTVLLLSAPAGRYVLSVEAWSPPDRRAGRYRAGLRRDTVPPDVATLSDLLLVAETDGAGDPASLEAAVGRALIRPEITMGQGVGVVWEVNGLGWAPATVSYELSVEAADQGFFRRIAEGLGLAGRERPLSLTWEEPGPDRPSVLLRHVALTLPEVDPGTYRVRLRAHISGRSPLTSEATLHVTASTR